MLRSDLVECEKIMKKMESRFQEKLGLISNELDAQRELCNALENSLKVAEQEYRSLEVEYEGLKPMMEMKLKEKEREMKEVLELVERYKRKSNMKIASLQNEVKLAWEGRKKASSKELEMMSQMSGERNEIMQKNRLLEELNEVLTKEVEKLKKMLLSEREKRLADVMSMELQEARGPTFAMSALR